MRINSPCLHCPNRHPACHDSCDRYKAYVAELEKQKAFNASFKSPASWLTEREFENYKRDRKRKRTGR